jgi:hypothetical protein
MNMATTKEEVTKKDIRGEECYRLCPALAKGHGKQPRAIIWLNKEDRTKIRRGPRTWEEVVTDQATGTHYHIEGKACGLTDDEGHPVCVCDALAWSVTATEFKKFKRELR